MAGTGLIAHPDAIRRYARVVGEQEGRLARIGGTLAGVRLPADAFGKLPEAGELHSAYTGHADDVREIAGWLPGRIGDVAAGLYQTAGTYADLEEEMARGIRELSGAPGGAGGTSPAGDALGAFAGIITQTQGAYGWARAPETALPALATGHDGASGGLSGMLDTAVNWVISHVPELPKLLDDVTGNTGALDGAATVWHDQGAVLNTVTGELRAQAAGLPEQWAGDASEAFGDFMADVTSGLSDLAEAMGQVQRILQDAAEEAAFARDTIVTIIREAAEWVAGNLAVDALTLGLATGAEAIGATAFLARKVADAEEAADRLASVYRALLAVVRKLQDVRGVYREATGLGRLRSFTSLARDLDAGLEPGRLANLRMFGEGRLAAAAKAVWGAGRHAKGMPEVIESGKDAVVGYTAAKAGLAGAMGATGLSSDPGLKGLAGDLADGNLDNLSGNAQGAAETLGLGTPPIPPAPPVNQIAAQINRTEPPQEP